MELKINNFMKLREIENLGKELSLNTQKLYLEETMALLNDIDEDILILKKTNIKQKE